MKKENGKRKLIKEMIKETLKLIKEKWNKKNEKEMGKQIENKT